MKKLIAMMLAGAMLFAATGCSSNENTEDAVAKYGSDTLKLYNWGEYMGENLISDFEKEFGVKVIVEYYDSNEMMYTKLMAGDRYDVVMVGITKDGDWILFGGKDYGMLPAGTWQNCEENRRAAISPVPPLGRYCTV